ncbi:hypothetical protein GCM10007171_32780 [Dickeya fangzhongdai]|nr:hypothetical protein GCM10007171_32780 [Dickeya fangzhongdai]
MSITQVFQKGSDHTNIIRGLSPNKWRKKLILEKSKVETSFILPYMDALGDVSADSMRFVTTYPAAKTCRSGLCNNFYSGNETNSQARTAGYD